MDAIAADSPLASVVEPDPSGEPVARLRVDVGELPAQRVAIDARGAEVSLVALEVVDDAVAATGLGALFVVVEGENQ